MNKTLPAWLLCILINAMPVMASDDESYLFSKGIDIQLNKHVIDNNDNKIKWTAFLRDGTPLEAINGDEHDQRFHIHHNTFARLTQAIIQLVNTIWTSSFR